MKEKYYLAYGSNLSMGQMAQRCPDAVYVGTADIPDYQLLFKGSQSGSYLTIEPKAGCTVPVLVWKISKRDERNLDRYEGCPSFYYKRLLPVSIHSLLSDSEVIQADAIVYIMHEERPLGMPTLHYYDICLEGYYRFGFNSKVLENALADSVGKKLARKMLKEVGYYG